MTNPNPPRPSHLFTVRIWAEAMGDGQFEYRGTAQHVMSGQTRHFRAWPALAEFLETTVQAFDNPPGNHQNDAIGQTDGD